MGRASEGSTGLAIEARGGFRSPDEARNRSCRGLPKGAAALHGWLVDVEKVADARRERCLLARWSREQLEQLRAIIRSTCTCESCGDGHVDANEACDDGNQDDDDACTHLCTVPQCGDLIVQAALGETCDDGNAVDTDACVGCQAARCGDGDVWAGHEQCDDGDLADDDGCLSTCSFASCGDGHVWQNAEECDDGNGSPTDACLSDCSVASCGDGCFPTGMFDDYCVGG